MDDDLEEPVDVDEDGNEVEYIVIELPEDLPPEAAKLCESGQTVTLRGLESETPVLECADGTKLPGSYRHLCGTSLLVEVRAQPGEELKGRYIGRAGIAMPVRAPEGDAQSKTPAPDTSLHAPPTSKAAEGQKQD